MHRGGSLEKAGGGRVDIESTFRYLLTPTERLRVIGPRDSRAVKMMIGPVKRFLGSSLTETVFEPPKIFAIVILSLLQETRKTLANVEIRCC